MFSWVCLHSLNDCNVWTSRSKFKSKSVLFIYNTVDLSVKNFCMITMSLISAQRPKRRHIVIRPQYTLIHLHLDLREMMNTNSSLQGSQRLAAWRRMFNTSSSSVLMLLEASQLFWMLLYFWLHLVTETDSSEQRSVFWSQLCRKQDGIEKRNILSK